MRTPARLLSRFFFVAAICSALFITQLLQGQSLQYTATKPLAVSKNGIGYFNSILGDDKDYLYVKTSWGGLTNKNLTLVVFDKRTMDVVGELILESTNENYVTNCFALEGRIYVFRIENSSEKHQLTCEMLDSKFQQLISKTTLYTYTPARESAALNIQHAFGKDLLISVVKTLIDPQDNKISLRCMFFDDELNEIQNKLFPTTQELNLAEVNNESVHLETALHNDGTLYIELGVVGYSRGIGTVNTRNESNFYEYNYREEGLREIEIAQRDDQYYYVGKSGDTDNIYEAYVTFEGKKEDAADRKIKDIILKPIQSKSGQAKSIKISLPSEFLSEVDPNAVGARDRKSSTNDPEKNYIPFRDIQIDHFIRDESGIILIFHSVNHWAGWAGDICIVKINLAGDVIWKSKIERKISYQYSYTDDVKIIVGTNELYFERKNDLDTKSLKEQRKQIKEEGHSLNYVRINRKNGGIINDNLKLPISGLDLELVSYQKDYQFIWFNNQIIIQAFSKDGKAKKEGHYIRIFAN